MALVALRARALFSLAAVAAGAIMANAGPALADRIKHPTAVFAGLDKITGRIIAFEAATDETVQFGSLQVTPRACYTRPATEAPQTTTFVEVDEVAASSNDSKRIFGGWMYAASPGLHGIEHPIYDIWLTDCKGGTEVIKTGPDVADLPPPTATDDPRQPKPGTVPLPKPKKPPVNVTPGPEPAPPAPVVERKSPLQRLFPPADPTQVGRDPAGKN
jgi:hypothetical protein